MAEPVSAMGLSPMSKQPAPAKPRPGTLAAIVGVVSAGLLLTAVPKEGSGRTVAVNIDVDGSAKVRHAAGRQYLSAYLDSVGVATACDGITRGVRLGQRYTEAQCA